MARNLTPEENAARIAEYRAMIAGGATLKEIAARWRCSPASLREWRGVHGLAPPVRRVKERKKPEARPDVEAARAAPKMQKICCTCSKTFKSTRADGAWLRMCDSCRGRPMSPYTPGGAGHTGRRVGVSKAVVR